MIILYITSVSGSLEVRAYRRLCVCVCVCVCVRHCGWTEVDRQRASRRTCWHNICLCACISVCVCVNLCVRVCHPPLPSLGACICT
jgi:hypothetical protein